MKEMRGVMHVKRGWTSQVRSLFIFVEIKGERERKRERERERERKRLVMLSISWDASLEGKKTLDENGSSLSSRNAAEVSETEVETAPRADGNRDKVLVPPAGVSNSSFRPGLNVSE